jgi:transcription elongation GreA/GreB family factor
MAEARAAYNTFQLFEDANERRRASASALRDMNYFSERLRSAQLVSTSLMDGALSFGNHVTFKRKNGSRQSYRIVGEDEADPRQGTISYASPLARVLMGKVAGDLVEFGEDEIEVLRIERQAD